jgi:hypothetical protein
MYGDKDLISNKNILEKRVPSPKKKFFKAKDKMQNECKKKAKYNRICKYFLY